MGVVVPVGEGVATFVFSQANSSKRPTWSIGLDVGEIGIPSAIAALVRTAFTDGFSAGQRGPYHTSVMSSAWSFLGVSVMVMTTPGPIVGEEMVTVVGSLSVPPIPMNCTYLASKGTALGGRRNKGRAYLPPLNTDEGSINGGGQFEVGARQVVQDLYDNAWLQLAIDGPVRLLHHSDGAPGTPITSFEIGNTIATQRRRLR
jgi:hypothetical protein